jgi:hypothetical protein
MGTQTIGTLMRKGYLSCSEARRGALYLTETDEKQIPRRALQ